MVLLNPPNYGNDEETERKRMHENDRPTVHHHHHYHRQSPAEPRGVGRDSIMWLCVGELNERHNNILTFLQRMPSASYACLKRPFHQFSNYPSEIQVTTRARANTSAHIVRNKLITYNSNQWVRKCASGNPTAFENFLHQISKWMNVNKFENGYMSVNDNA